MGEVISELARKGLRPAPTPVDDDDFPVFEVSASVEALTPEMVERANQD